MQDEVNNPAYWDAIADDYRRELWISSHDFHLGPLLPGGGEWQLLPRNLQGLTCLEIGCGAGQNSIYLARHGAACTALDASARQLEEGARLAAEAGVRVDFQHVAMEAMDASALGAFDLVHSVFALGFAERPEEVIRSAARAMRPNAMLVLSVIHPLFHHEWLNLDSEEWGLFVPNYFSPPEDRQESPMGPTAIARAYPISTVVGWLADAGLCVTRLLEPQAVPLQDLPDGKAGSRAPYDGMPWRPLHDLLRKIPVAAIYVAKKSECG